MSGVEAVAGSAAARTKQSSGRLRRVLGNKWFLRALSLAVLLTLWQMFGNRFSTSFPDDIARSFPHSFWNEVLPAYKDTLKGFTAGYFVAVVVGIPVGLAMARSRLVELALEPYVAALYATPRLALIPVLILWFGIGFEMRFAVVVMSGIFPIILNTYIGGKEVDPNLLDAGKAFNANAFQTLRTIVVPGSLGYIFAGLRLGMARAFIGIIVAEIETSVLGIGNLISSDVSQLRFADMWVAIISLGIFSLLFTSALKAAERWATLPWMRRKKATQWLSPL